MAHDIWLWIFFNLFIVVLLVADLWLFHRKSHTIEIKEALAMSAMWVAISLLFNLWIFETRGLEDGLNFLTGYLVEKSLSVDNLFVFLLIFQYFAVPHRYLHRVLFWGVLGAIVMRTIFILGGIVIISHFHWLLYVLGAFLVITGVKLAMEKDSKIEPEHNPVLKLFRKLVPVTKDYEDGHFFVRREGKWFATPLFIVLLAVETTDVIFAMDSIPAIFAITLDPFIVYTSNIFAILGLRAFFFALSGVMSMFYYLNYGLSAILVFIGFKMLVSGYYKIPITVVLGFIVCALTVAIVASIRRDRRIKK